MLLECVNLDGARVFNAAEVLQVPVARIAKDFDSVCFCVSKGLSAPVGSLLVGSKAFINEARRLRKALGGGMRQAGILAAAGLVALETIVPRLKEDHLRTRRIAEAIHSLRSPNITVDIDNVHSNILLIHMTNPKLDASEFAKRMAEVKPEELQDGLTASEKELRGVRVNISSRDWAYARIVLYEQINDVDVQLAIKKFTYVIKEFDKKL